MNPNQGGNARSIIAISMVAVASSQLQAIGYDEATKTLQIDFIGSHESIYQYHGVSLATFEAMKAAQTAKDGGDENASVGKIFYADVKNNAPFTRFSRATHEVEKEWEPKAEQQVAA